MFPNAIVCVDVKLVEVRHDVKSGEVNDNVKSGARLVIVEVYVHEQQFTNK